jgi:hypothetical protein
LVEYKQEKPIQLTLFELLLPGEQAYSNTVELYDFIPKYHWGKVERVNGMFLSRSNANSSVGERVIP